MEGRLRLRAPSSCKSAIFLIMTKERYDKCFKIEKPDKLLILGTSDEMVETIVKNLELGEIHQGFI